jgi:DNA-binding protein H-NS
MTDLSELSLEQLQKRLEELGTEWHLVEEAIEQKKEAGKNELAAEVRQKITDAGHDVADIVGLLQGRKRRTRSTSKSYATYVDPDNAANTYVRGVLPGWMKEKMAAKGLDPASKEDRETFKQKHLKVES